MAGPDATEEGTFWDRLIFDHISPTMVVVELFYGLLMAMALSNTLRLALIGEQPDQMAFVIGVAILGCNAAWGIADGAVNTLTSHYQNLYYYRLVKRIKDGKDHQATRELTAEVLTEALTEIQEDVLDEETMQKMADVVLHAIKRKDIVRPRVGHSQLLTGLWCLVLNLVAALPFVAVYQLMPYLNANLVTLMANVLGAVLLFLLGRFLDRNMGEGQMRTGWIMVGLGMLMLVVIIIFGG